ncbi:hypothetical protein ACCS64_39310, partial [Rhizobium ruizarguesonis]
MGEITSLAKETIVIAKQYAGEEVVDEVVASVPGLTLICCDGRQTVICSTSIGTTLDFHPGDENSEPRNKA